MQVKQKRPSNFFEYEIHGNNLDHSWQQSRLGKPHFVRLSLNNVGGKLIDFILIKFSYYLLFGEPMKHQKYRWF